MTRPRHDAPTPPSPPDESVTYPRARPFGQEEVDSATRLWRSQQDVFDDSKTIAVTRWHDTDVDVPRLPERDLDDTRPPPTLMPPDARAVIAALAIQPPPPTPPPTPATTMQGLDRLPRPLSHFPEATSALAEGLELGNYVIGRVLATGGMGVVYEAEHRYLRRKVAVKVLRRSRVDPDATRRFFNEAVAATQIGHRGMIEVIDYGYAPDGAAYLVMELLSGASLARRLVERGKLTVREALEVGRSVAETLEVAHAAGIVHRDIKPDNIFLAYREGAPDQVKLLDFGVAKFLEASEEEKTEFGTLLGTPNYMSPEQCDGRREVDHRSDVYSLGCVLFEMLTGRCPFAGNSVDVLSAHRRKQPPSVRLFNPDVPQAIDALIQWMLAKDAGERPQNMAHVVSELASAEQAPPNPRGSGQMHAPRTPAPDIVRETPLPGMPPAAVAEPRPGKWRLAPTVLAPARDDAVNDVTATAEYRPLPAPRRSGPPARGLFVLVALLALAGGAVLYAAVSALQ